MASLTRSEAEIAADVVSWLEGFEVYQEVAFSGRVADIVVDVAGRGWIIEVKRSLGMAVFEQAEFWRRYGAATRVSVAVPHPRTFNHFALRVAEMVGCGIITVTRWGSVREHKAAPFFRLKGRDILGACEPEHKHVCAAGSANGGHWTPFRKTCREVLKAVQGQPGLTMAEVVARIDHHYVHDATAKSSLRQWVDAGKVPGVKAVRDGRRIRFFPKEGDNGEPDPPNSGR